MDGDEATTISPLFSTTYITQGRGSNAKEEKKFTIEEKEAGEGHEPHPRGTRVKDDPS